MATINEIRNLNKRMGNEPKNFLYELRGTTTNNAVMVSINELNAKSLISKHSGDGYIIISPCRGYADFGLDSTNPLSKGELSRINNERIRKFIEQIKDSGYSYTPAYGGFIENKGEPEEEQVYERSFIIYNRDKEGNKKDFNDLYEKGLEWCKEYNQDSILVKAPNEPPKYIKGDGSIDTQFNGDVLFNDFAQEYFTDLHKNTHKGKDDIGRTPTRFTYTETYINPAPQCLSEAHSRYLSGEVFIPYR